MDVDRYLSRIGHIGAVTPTLENLCGIQRAHAQTIPYETFDIFLRKPMTTDPAAAFAKIVNEQRGGWCYEHNGLLAWALTKLGFRVRRLTAGIDRPATHLTLRVDIPGEGVFICDPGFSDAPLDPFPLREGDFSQYGFSYRIEFIGAGQFRFINHPLGLASGYSTSPTDETAMERASYWLQTARESRLASKPITSIRERDGTVRCLSGTNLLTIRPDNITRRRLESAGEYVSALEEVFGLRLPQAGALWPGIAARDAAHDRRRAASARTDRRTRLPPG